MATFIYPMSIDAEGKDVEFNGLDFSDHSSITVVNAKSVTIRNCRIYTLSGDSSNNYWINIQGDIPVKVVIERNFFGANTGIYKLLELTCKLTKDSSISNNYFADGCCTHNYAGIYGANENAAININMNVFEKSKEGGVRLGMKGNATCKFNVNNNRIMAKSNPTDETLEGLLRLQPYGTLTTSMAKCTIYMNHNTIPSNQVVYAYYGSDDTPMTKDLIPKVILDRVQHFYPIRH